MARPFYVTTPIYYVNDVPHLGTAYTTVVADAVARYHRLRGADTFFLTGTDEHGLKIERQAKEQGISPKAFVDKMSAPFREAWPRLSIEPNHFIRTTDEGHQAFVTDLWRRIEKNGDLYLGHHEGWYCVGCESFKTEKELLVGNVCPLHQRPAERLKEETYFFKLASYEKRLLALYEKHPSFIRPETRRNEVISFVEGGLKDLSVSRASFSWGIPVPNDPRHVMYVWFDALTNYRSALGNGANARFWPPSGRVVHLVGKDILRFHAVYWPAFLLAAGYDEDALPSSIFAHGFLTIDGQKMSKSLRNAVDPVRLADELGADVIRYHLLRAIAFGQDGDFDHAALLERYNADLGKNLGNLLSRVLGLCTKLTDGKTPAFGVKTALEDELFQKVEEALAEAAVAWDVLEPHRALEATWAISSLANQYVDRAAPWAAAKSGDTERVETPLAVLLEILRVLSVLVWPAIPTKANELRAQLALPPLAPSLEHDAWPKVLTPRPKGEALAPTGPLFPTYDADAVKALLAKLQPKVDPPDVAPPTPRTLPDPLTLAASVPPPAEAKQGEASAVEGVLPITYDDFTKIDLRVGLVVKAERVAKKDKLLRLEVDLGEGPPRQIVAGLALTFTPEALVGRRVVVVANLAPRDFGKGLVSHGMLLASGPSEALNLATIGDAVAPGAKLK